MEQNSQKIIQYQNFTFDERHKFGVTLAKIFTKRLLFEERSLLFLEYEKDSIKIELGLPENFFIPGVESLAFGWIPDLKYKILTKKPEDLQFLYPQKRNVWIDVKIGDDADFQKEKKDIMSFMSLNPENIVISCFIIPDAKQSKLILKFYWMQSRKGWTKIKEYIYSSISEFDNLTSAERGDLGESLAKIFTKRLLLEKRAQLFPEYEGEFIKIEEGISLDYTNPNRRYFSPELFQHAKNTHQSWIPDAIFQLLTNINPFDLKFELKPKKFVWLEVKTGKEAKLERWQRNDIEYLNENPFNILLLCQISPDCENSKLKLTFSKMQEDSNWKKIGEYSYTDF
jgi:hypothetical protein